MKALWIRVEAHEVESKRIAQLAEALEIDDVTALGHYVALGGAIAEQSPDGSIGDVSDRKIEVWGRWSGRKGKFAKVVRDQLQDEGGVFVDWEESMGKLVERRAAERGRKAEERRKKVESQQRLANERAETRPRTVRGTSADNPRTVRGKSGATERNGTERDGTIPLKTTSGSLASEKKPASLRSKSDPQQLAGLPPNVGRFVDRYYPVAGDRRADVVRQLAKLAAGERIQDSRVSVVAYSIERLDAKCLEVIDEDTVRDLNQAIAVLFTKLNDTTDVSAEWARNEKAPFEEAARDGAEADRLIERWEDEHPADAEQLRSELVDEFPGAGDVIHTTRRLAFRSRAMQRLERVDSP